MSASVPIRYRWLGVPQPGQPAANLPVDKLKVVEATGR